LKFIISFGVFVQFTKGYSYNWIDVSCITFVRIVVGEIIGIFQGYVSLRTRRIIEESLSLEELYHSQKIVSPTSNLYHLLGRWLSVSLEKNMWNFDMRMSDKKNNGESEKLG